MSLPVNFDSLSPVEQIKILRQENENLKAAQSAPKAIKVYVDPKGSGRVCVTGFGRGGVEKLTLTACKVLTSPGIIDQIAACVKAHPELEAQYAAFALTFKNEDGTPKARGQR